MVSLVYINIVCKGKNFNHVREFLTLPTPPLIWSVVTMTLEVHTEVAVCRISDRVGILCRRTKHHNSTAVRNVNSLMPTDHPGQDEDNSERIMKITAQLTKLHVKVERHVLWLADLTVFHAVFWLSNWKSERRAIHLHRLDDCQWMFFAVFLVRIACTYSA